MGFSARSRPLSDLRLRLTIAFTRFKSPGLLSLKLNALVLVLLEASDQVEQLAEWRIGHRRPAGCSEPGFRRRAQSRRDA